MLFRSAEGMPLAVIRQLASLYLTQLGLPESALGRANFWLGLPWNLKFLWAPLVDQWSTHRRWYLTMEWALAIGCLGLVVAAQWGPPAIDKASGLPVLTCSGHAFAGRVATSLLNAVGLPEMATGTLADYEALALRLARDPAALAAIRSKLAANRMTHPLFDTARFTRHLEAAYVRMWERSQRGLPPEAFAVPTGAN